MSVVGTLGAVYAGLEIAGAVGSALSKAYESYTGRPLTVAEVIETAKSTASSINETLSSSVKAGALSTMAGMALQVGDSGGKGEIGTNLGISGGEDVGSDNVKLSGAVTTPPPAFSRGV